jgi:shikimate dehydrogenase
MTRQHKFGLIGYNTSYSRSPEVFQAIFAIRNVSGIYENYSLEPPQFEQRFRELVRDGLQGLSVTIPYKSRVIPLLDEVDPVARALNAVNSVSIGNDLLIGFNTDCFGFSVPLRPYHDKLKHGHAIILGCGGGARAAVYSLHTDYEVKHFTVLGRSAARLDAFRQSLVGQIAAISMETRQFEDYSGDAPYDIIVNCTHLGGWNHPAELAFPARMRWLPGKIYYDLNYSADNKALGKAAEEGLLPIDGSAMLVGQAIRSFQIWTGMDVPFDRVYERVFESRL